MLRKIPEDRRSTYTLLVALVHLCNFSCSPGERGLVIIYESSCFQVCCVMLNIICFTCTWTMGFFLKKIKHTKMHIVGCIAELRQFTVGCLCVVVTTCGCKCPGYLWGLLTICAFHLRVDIKQLVLTGPSWISCEAGLARWRIKLHATFLFWSDVCSTLSLRVYLAHHPSTPDRSASLTRNLKTGNVDKYYNQLHSRDPPGAAVNCVPLS